MILCPHEQTTLCEFPNAGRTAKDEKCSSCGLLRSTMTKHMERLPHDFNPDEMDVEPMWMLERWHQQHHDYGKSEHTPPEVINHRRDDYDDGVPYKPVKQMVADLKAIAAWTG